MHGLRLIGLAGKAGVGKDYVGTHLLQPRGYRPVPFALALKAQAVARGISYEDVFINKPPDVRTMLQVVGTEQGRNVYGEDYWVRQAYSLIRYLNESWGWQDFYIPDVRFPNEAQFVRDMGGKLVHLIHGHGLSCPFAGTEQALHRSETALDEWRDWDLEFANSTDSSAMTNLGVKLEDAGIIPGGWYRGQF